MVKVGGQGNQTDNLPSDMMRNLPPVPGAGQGGQQGNKGKTTKSTKRRWR